MIHFCSGVIFDRAETVCGLPLKNITISSRWKDITCPDCREKLTVPEELLK